MPSAITLILGGARSGKSRHGEALVAALTPERAVYLATGQAGDAEMQERIRLHRERRGGFWTTIEEPLELAQAIRAHRGEPILVDCLTLWLSNLMLAGRDAEAAGADLIAALAAPGAPVFLVANEVGLGIVPDNALAREFRDRAGRLNQAVAAAADKVIFVAAGLPLALKG